MNVITRQEAMVAGLKRYYTGVACKRGHISERQVASRDCVECALENQRAGWPLRREKKLAQHKEWLARNPGYRRAYWEANKEQQKAWQDANRDLCNASTKRWREKNLESCRSKQRVRRTMRRAAEGKFTAADIARLLRAQKCKCAYCRTTLDRYHVDHILPVKLGGTHWPENLQLLCPTCNRRK